MEEDTTFDLSDMYPLFDKLSRINMENKEYE